MKKTIDPNNPVHRDMYNSMSWLELHTHFIGSMYTLIKKMGPKKDLHKNPRTISKPRDEACIDNKGFRVRHLNKGKWDIPTMEYSNLKPAHPEIFGKEFR